MKFIVSKIYGSITEHSLVLFLLCLSHCLLFWRGLRGKVLRKKVYIQKCRFFESRGQWNGTYNVNEILRGLKIHK
jgi:hypothetical protein